MPSLSKRLSKINISIQYDTVTLYPTEMKQVTCQQMSMFITRCGQIGLLFPGCQIEENIVEANESMNPLQKLPEYDRFIHRQDHDHDLYHQDEFKIEDNHYHYKSKHILNHDRLRQICDIAISTDIMTQAEAAGLLADFDDRYQTKIVALADRLTESKDMNVANKAIHQFIAQCDDLDTLTFLHQQLLAPKYAFLRSKSLQQNPLLAPLPSGWYATASQDGAVREVNPSWAKIEKSFELQMMHIMDNVCQMDAGVGHERASEFHVDSPFFGIKRHQKGPYDALARNKLFTLFNQGDAKAIEQEYKTHFAKFGH